MMEMSQLREAPYEVGRPRLFDQMNSRGGHFTHVLRLVNPEKARMIFHYSPGARVEAWHQSGVELAALYSWNGVWVLFDRFHAGHATIEGECDTVVVISAPTLELQLGAVTLIATSSSGMEMTEILGADDE